MAASVVRLEEDAKHIERAIRAACARLGYSSLRKEQEEVLKSFLNRKDVFVSLPTGRGKSLCYALLPFVFDELRQKFG